MYGRSYFSHVRNRQLGRTPRSVPIVRRRARPNHVASRVVRVLRRSAGRARAAVAARDTVQINRRRTARTYNRRRGIVGLHMPYRGSRLNRSVYR